MHIDFSADCDTVNHQGILFNLCSVSNGGSVLSVLTQFISNYRSRNVVLDGCRSNLVNGVSGVPQVCAPCCFTLIAVVPSPLDRIAVAESGNHDLNGVYELCDHWGMKLNVGKTKTMIVQVTHNPQSPSSVVVFCMLSNTWNNHVHPFCGALPVPFVAVRVTRGALVLICILMHLLAAEPQSTAGLL